METKAERSQQLREQAEKMVDWFGSIKQLPAEPVQLTACTKILRVKKFIETQTATIEATKNDPFNRVFRLAYMRLYHLKIVIENEQLGTTNS